MTTYNFGNNGTFLPFGSGNTLFEQTLVAGVSGYLRDVYVYSKVAIVGNRFRARVRDNLGNYVAESFGIVTSSTGDYSRITFATPPFLETSKTYLLMLDNPTDEMFLGQGVLGASSSAWVVNGGVASDSGLPIAIYFSVVSFAKTTFVNGQAPAVSAEQLNKLGQGIEIALDSNNWIYNYGQYSVSVPVQPNGGTNTTSIAVNPGRIFELYCRTYNEKYAHFYLDTKNPSQLIKINMGGGYSLFGNDGTENLLEGTVFNNSTSNVYFLTRIQYNTGTLTFTFLNNHTVVSEMGMSLIIRSMG